LRGRIYAILQLSQPLGYLIGTILAMMLSSIIGWRSVFYITSLLGVVLSLLIFFGVRDVSRGKAEQKFAGLIEIGQHKFS